MKYLDEPLNEHYNFRKSLSHFERVLHQIQEQKSASRQEVTLVVFINQVMKTH